MDTSAVSSLNPILGVVTPTKTAVGNAINPPTGPDFDGLAVTKQAERAAVETREGRALQILRKELADEAVPKRSAEGAYQSVLGNDDVATAALNAARRSVGENADISSFALLRFRQRVQAAAADARQAVEGDADTGQLDATLGNIESGLRSLDERAARNVESSASVLAVDTKERQASTIRIRTQEGDLVRLDLTSINRVTARDVSVADSAGEGSQTDVSVTSRSRVRLRVDGDLSDSEYEAIKNVFAQAESIAGEFFNGDLGAAFSLASGLDFDSGQLARVNLRFRSEQESSARFAGSVTTIASPAAPVVTPSRSVAVASVSGSTNSQAALRQVANEPRTEPVLPSGAETVAKPATQNDTAAVARQQSVVEGGESPAAAAAAGIDLTSSDFARFFELLGDFLRSVADGFDRLADSLSPAAGGASETSADKPASEKPAGADYLSYHFSQAFKLEVFKSVLAVSAPDPAASDASRLAAELIDGLQDVSVVDAIDA